MSARIFLDTNILVYAYSTDDKFKQQKAVSAIINNDCFVSTQVLNEFCNVCSKKLHLSIAAIQQDLAEITNFCSYRPVYKSTIESALILQEHYGFSYYDSLIAASALEADCEYLYTEDLTDGQYINSLKIQNIFI